MWLYPYTPVSIVMCPSYSFSDYSTLSLFYQTAAFNFDKANTIAINTNKKEGKFAKINLQTSAILNLPALKTVIFTSK